MASEIERKFLVRTLPDPEVLGRGTPLRQGYLALDGAVEVRLRRAPASAVMTVKAGSGLARTEVEVPLDDGDADALWPHTEGRRLEKLRYRVPVTAGLVSDLDVYGGALEGLVTVEVEFSDDAAARAFAAPAWFGPELTGARGWSNAELAVEGPPAVEQAP